jgi:tetratricopeptide (TPR) repeat protein
MNAVASLRTGPVRHGLAAAVVAWMAAGPAGRAADAPAARASEIRPTAPVKLRYWTEKDSREVTVIGRSDELLVLSGESGTGGSPRLAVKDILRAEFEIDYDRFAVAKAVRLQDWNGAIRELQKAVGPVLPYLDLPENGADETSLDLGTYMLRAAERSSRTATNETGQALSKRQYEAAYETFKVCARVAWSSVGQLAVLKGCRCLLALGKPKTARYHIEEMEEPTPGDAAYGHYWLVRGELAALAGDYRTAMDAAVKSVDFENKDVETFPDALLLTARCYGELLEPYRARDVYFEVAKLFPRTDWAATAIERLRTIVAKGITRQPEKSPIENVFFKTADDVNALVDQLLKQVDNPAAAEEDENEDLPAPKLGNEPADTDKDKDPDAPPPDAMPPPATPPPPAGPPATKPPSTTRMPGTKAPAAK